MVMAVFAGLLTGCTSDSGSRRSGSVNADGTTVSAPFNDRFYNPIRTQFRLGDPWIIHHDGIYYYCGGGINLFASPTLSGMQAYSNITRKSVFSPEANGVTQVWAPELHHFNNRWYIFFTATQGSDDDAHRNRRIYVLRSHDNNAMGEYEFMGKLQLPEDQWAIDGTFFEHNGRLFLIWSGWKDESEGIGVWRQSLYIAELQPGDPTRVLPGTARVLIAAPEYEWEQRGLSQLEGPVMVKSPGGNVYCIYSASFSRSNFYALGVLRLTGDDPMNPSHWRKRNIPLLSSDPDNDIYSPGHCSVTMSPDGTEYWVVYHAAKARGAGWDRNARVQRLLWDEHDEPYMENQAGVQGLPDPLWITQPLPSGETVDRIIVQAEDMAARGGTSLVQISGGGRAVSLVPDNGIITMTVAIDEEASYAVYIRHSNYHNEEERILITVNDAPPVAVAASRSGAEGSFTMAAGMVTLNSGIHTLSFSVPSYSGQMDIDCVILEKIIPFRYSNQEQ